MTIDAMADLYTEISRLIKDGEFTKAARAMTSDEFRALPADVQQDIADHFRKRAAAFWRA